MTTFDVLLLTGRPGAGGAEVVQYLAGLPADLRLHSHFLKDLVVFDEIDFFADSFETDELMSEHSRPRLFSDAHRFLLDDFLWDCSIHKLNRRYDRLLLRDPGFFQHHTLVVVLSRGGAHGYRQALSLLRPELTSRAVLLHVSTSFPELLRRNRQLRREQPRSGLAPLVFTEEQLITYFRTDDWAELADPAKQEGNESRELRRESQPPLGELRAADEDFLHLGEELRLPYVVLDNEERIVDDPATLGGELERLCHRLRQLPRT